jgi:DNA-binding transcriptional ArsR family regulator
MSALQSCAALDRMFQALADPARRGMIEQLCRAPSSVSELAKPLSMTLSAVVQHLQVLESSGLVRTQKMGRVRTCHVDAAALRNVENWVVQRRSQWQRRFDRLGDYLNEQDEASQAVGKVVANKRSKTRGE